LALLFKSNGARWKDATAILNRVGFENLADILQSDRLRLYDPKRNGGLWVGRDYGGGKVWKRDPLHGISHGATAMQAARFYYLGVTGRLIAPELRSEAREIMSSPAIKHKFVKGLEKANPEAEIYRKSGTWRHFHADSGVIVAEGYQYIVAALVEHPQGAEGMAKFIGLVDRTVADLRGVAK
jgi:beta-lactamase class A